jgi:hypothetical protein
VLFGWVLFGSFFFFSAPWLVALNRAAFNAGAAQRGGQGVGLSRNWNRQGCSAPPAPTAERGGVSSVYAGKR